MKVPAGISFRSMPTLFVSKVQSGDVGAATEDSGAVADGVADNGDDSPQPARNHVVARDTSHKLNPYRMTISL